MAHKTHLLNRILPMWLRAGLRQGASSFIPSLRHLDMSKRMRHWKSVGLNPGVVLDVGAATGEWAAMAASTWPGARVIGFEPNEPNHPALTALAQRDPRFSFHRCFLGPENRTVTYDERGTQTSLADLDGTIAAGEGRQASAEMATLDTLVARGTVPQPQFIKLDVQGFELQVLRGAETALQDGCEAVLTEVNFYKPSSSVSRVDEVIRFMNERGFAWYDVAGLLRRPIDDALWQMDLLFLREGHPLRSKQLFTTH